VESWGDPSRWLLIGSTVGRVDRPLQDVSMVNVAVNISGLDPGEYYGKIDITGDAQNSPQSVTVVVTVLPGGANPGPEVRPTGLIFVGGPNEKPGPQTVDVTNLIAQPVAFTSAQLTFDGAKVTEPITRQGDAGAGYARAVERAVGQPGADRGRAPRRGDYAVR
jgi:hypothetical protein